MTRQWLPVLAISAVALAVRMAFVVIQADGAPFVLSFTEGDARIYLELARGIVEDRRYALSGVATAYVTPGYPVFVACVLALGGDTLAIGLVQAVLGAGTVIMAYIATRALAAERGTTAALAHRFALLAASATAVYPHLIMWTGYVLTETLFVFLTSATLVAAISALRRDSLVVVSAAGLLAGLTSLVRPPFIAFLVVLVVWWLVRVVLGPRRVAGAVAVAAFVLSAAAPLVIWTIRNSVVLGAPIVTSTEAGNVFYQGNSKYSTGGSRGYVDANANDYVLLSVRVARGDADPGLPPFADEVSSDRAHMHQAIRDMAADPVAVIRRWPTKLWNMWRPTYEDASLRNGLVTLATYLPVSLLGVIGTAVILRRRPFGPAAVPALFLVAWVSAHVLVTGMIRFRVAAELVLLVAAPFGLAAVHELLRRGARPRAVRRP